MDETGVEVDETEGDEDEEGTDAARARGDRAGRRMPGAATRRRGGTVGMPPNRNQVRLKREEESVARSRGGGRGVKEN